MVVVVVACRVYGLFGWCKAMGKLRVQGLRGGTLWVCEAGVGGRLIGVECWWLINKVASFVGFSGS